MIWKKSLLFLACTGIIACSNPGDTEKKENTGEKGKSVEKKDQKANKAPDKSKFPSALERGKVYEKNGTTYLYGGSDSAQHFRAPNLALKKENLHFGIGREHFPALIDPSFISVDEMAAHAGDTTEFLVAKMGEDVKAYSLKDLTRHEVVNDTLDGKPVMAAYCHLADLGAVYDRNMYGKTFTFGLSGYTYYEKDVWDGLDGFVLWDRETESLWWPLTGKAVSGKMKGAELKELNEQHWERMDWPTLKEEHPDARVLKPGQDMDPPEKWPSYEDPLGKKDKKG